MGGVGLSSRCAGSASGAEARCTVAARLPFGGRDGASYVSAVTVIVGLTLICSVAAGAALRVEPTVDELKAKLSAAQVGDKVNICLQIAQRQLVEADKLYVAGDTEKAQPALTDVVAFTELARDYSIQSRKHQKQAEIAVRGMTRKLTDLMHSVPREEQTPIADALQQLERVRDDLLLTMFPKGGKK